MGFVINLQRFIRNVETLLYERFLIKIGLGGGSMEGVHKTH